MYSRITIFWNALKVTFIFVVSTVILEFAIGLVLAVILNRLTSGERFYQSVVLLPIAMAPTVVG